MSNGLKKYLKNSSHTAPLCAIVLHYNLDYIKGVITDDDSLHLFDVEGQHCRSQSNEDVALERLNVS